MPGVTHLLLLSHGSGARRGVSRAWGWGVAASLWNLREIHAVAEGGGMSVASQVVDLVTRNGTLSAAERGLTCIVAGSRCVTDYNVVVGAIEASQWKLYCVVSGAARGVDRLGERYAAERGLHLTRFPAQWDLYGRSAGMRRNTEMAAYADALIAVWDGVSRGTANMIALMEKFGKPYFVRRVD